MASFLKKIVNNIATQRQVDQQAQLMHKLMRHEAEIGGQLFGPVGSNRHREFFCLDKHCWVWHEEWTDKNGQKHVVNTRYEVRPDGVLKSQNGGHYQQVSQTEINRLAQAANVYYDRIQKEVYNFV